MGTAQLLLKEAGVVPQFSIKIDHVLNIFFSKAEAAPQAFSQETFAYRLNFTLRNTRKGQDWPFSNRIEALTKLAEAGNAHRAPEVKLTPEFGRNVTLLVLAWKFIISFVA